MNKLKSIRLAKNYSMERLAFEAGVTVRYIAFLETQDRFPSLKVASKIAKILDTPIEEIFLTSNCTKSTEKGR